MGPIRGGKIRRALHGARAGPVSEHRIFVQNSPGTARTAPGSVMWLRHHQSRNSLWGHKMILKSSGFFFIALSWVFILAHWGWVTQIYLSKLTIIGSDNGLSPDRCQAIIWTSTGILLITPSGTNVNETLLEIHAFSFTKMCLKMLSWT